MTYLRKKENGIEKIYKNVIAAENDEGIVLPSGTLFFLLGREVSYTEGIIPNDFRETEDYYIETIGLTHYLYNREDKLLFESSDIIKVKSFVDDLYDCINLSPTLVSKRIEKIKNNWTKEEINLAYVSLFDFEAEEKILNTKMESVLFDNSYAEAILEIKA